MRWTCPKTLECCGFIFQSIHQYTLIAFARHFFSNTLNLAEKSLTCLMRQELFTFYEFWAESSIRVEAWVALTSLLIQMQSSSDVEDEERTNSEPHSFFRVGEFDQDWADLDVGCTDWHCLRKDINMSLFLKIKELEVSLAHKNFLGKAVSARPNKHQQTTLFG